MNLIHKYTRCEALPQVSETALGQYRNAVASGRTQISKKIVLRQS